MLGGAPGSGSGAFEDCYIVLRQLDVFAPSLKKFARVKEAQVPLGVHMIDQRVLGLGLVNQKK